MTLSEIAAGIEVTTEQRDRGAAVVDDTGIDLHDRLRSHASSLPCTAAAATTLIETYTAGASVGDAAREAAVAPMTAAKTLHRCGVSGVCPLAPTRRGIVRDWLAGRIGRRDAIELTGGDEADFALAVYVETHDPIADLADAVTRVDDHAIGVDTLGGSLETPDELR
ncbi:hypothetical protein SAMN05192561_1195 [Halopenitus malekzadehii]|uniref:Uncharacterized protein n=1 Tax=Halopenitus malekzadehii TaxID=1267564 RepID=A0A1H6JZ35_9EURY|nr:hypothetical protein [Halopenitus malekzadehii]SEH64410.1 hypothetical protein SAMN05192561_1195 [Halopenitus malekzadehii]